MASFGERLKQEREKQRISLDDVSLATKIGIRLLQALEEEKFDQLPGGIFNKGFVRAYARHLGLDENQAVADYLVAAGQSPPPDPLAHVPAPGKLPVKPEGKPGSPAQSVKKIEAVAESRPLPVFTDVVARKEENRPVSIPWGMLAILLFVVAVIFALWGYYTREEHPAAGRSPVAAARGSSTSPEAEGFSPASTPNLPAQPASSAPRAASVSTAGNLSPTPRSFLVLIRANNDSWLAITADGSKVFDDTMAAASEKSIPAHREIVVKAGNVGGLEFSFNGSKLPRQGGDGEVKTVTFGPGGLQTPAAKPPG